MPILPPDFWCHPPEKTGALETPGVVKTTAGVSGKEREAVDEGFYKQYEAALIAKGWLQGKIKRAES